VGCRSTAERLRVMGYAKLWLSCRYSRAVTMPMLLEQPRL
jgi:hypothetical protein